MNKKIKKFIKKLFAPRKVYYRYSKEIKEEDWNEIGEDFEKVFEDMNHVFKHMDKIFKKYNKENKSGVPQI